MATHGYDLGQIRPPGAPKVTPRKPALRALPKPARLVAVVRVSTARQADPDASPATQRRLCETYCDLYGAELVAVLEDVTSGARSPIRRPGMVQALAMLEEGKADGLLVAALSRFSRSTRDTLQIVDLFRRKGWRFVSVKEQLDTDTAHGRMVLTILSSVAQHEREQLQERLKDRAHRLMRERRAPTPKVPMGHTLTKDGHLVPNEEEGRAVARILLMHEHQGMGTHAIAQALNAEGFPHPRTGGLWTRPAIKSVLDTSKRRQAILQGEE